jgi:hypothetical protein
LPTRPRCNGAGIPQCFALHALRTHRSQCAWDVRGLDLRVRPETSGWIAKFSEHEADGGEAQESERRAIEVLPIFGEPPATVEPSQRAFNDPALGQHDEALGLIGSLDDVRLQAGQDGLAGAVELAALIGGVGEQRLQERIHPEQRRQQQHAAVAILNVGGMNDGVQQQTQRVYQNVALLALDLLTRIIARWVDVRPPFSALFTLWLSMMAAVGLASRSACSRHAT